MRGNCVRMKFCLDCETPSKFLISQWQSDINKPSVRYLIYRWILAVYFVFVVILSLITAQGCRQLSWYLIYLTNWNVILNGISSVYSAIIISMYYKNVISFNHNTADNDQKMLKRLKIQWVLWTLSLVVSIALSVVYWPFIYTGRDRGLNDALSHAGNAIVNIVDLFVIAFPPRFGHFVYSLGFGFIYSISFTLPYALAGGKNRHSHSYIYHVIDWLDKPVDATIFTLAMFVHITLIHFVVTFLMVLRELIHGKFNKNNENCTNKEKSSTLDIDNQAFNDDNV